MPLRLSGDFETASVADLSAVGAYRYARHPTTRILCFAWAVDDDEPELWFPRYGDPPKQLRNVIADGCEIHAWNAAFEFNIWNAVGKQFGLPPLPIERFHCSMARALYWGVPPKLEHAAHVVGTNVRKDIEGGKLMRLMMKPRKPRTGEDPNFLYWIDDEEPDKLSRLGDYCAQDVRTERAIVRRIKPLPTMERQVWLLDQRMNMRGLRIDLPAVENMQRVVNGELERLGGVMAKLTRGKVKSVTQTKAIVNHLKAQKDLTGEPVSIDGINKTVLPLVLAEPLTLIQRAILIVYQEGAKTSTAKLRAMRNYLDEDGRVRYLVQYGGALRTLRWAGRGPQIQNYPRPTKRYDLKWAIDDVVRGVDADGIRLVHGDPMDVVSQCLRGSYIPDDGRAFAVCDYSAIEARVVAWLAGQEDVLDIFRSGQDIYVAAAKGVGSTSRMLGKVIILACGYGMGWRRFIATAATFGIVLNEDEAKDAVYGWRQNNDRIKGLWYLVDDVVRMVLQERVVDRWVYAGEKLAFRMGKDGTPMHGAMLMRLPSGRPIVYRNASVDTIINDEDGAAEDEEVIRYDGLDFSKKWSRIRTWGGKVVENATQAMARDLLADAMLRLDDGSDDLDVTVHDELIAEPLIPRAQARLQQMKNIMSTPPDWAHGLPLAAEGAVMMRYGKG
jgi:DNA polymerase